MKKCLSLFLKYEKIKYRFEFIDLGGGMGISYNNKKKLDYKKYI